eukprot:6066756-Pleurochrysis_carterae.AAC.2
MSSPDYTQQPEAPVPKTKDVGQKDVEAEADVAGRKTVPNLDKMREAGADLPLPEEFVRVALAVEEDGTAVLILSPSASEGQAEKRNIESTPHSPAEPIRTGGSDYVQACREAREKEETKALEFMANTPPSLPPSPPPMHMDDMHAGPGGAGPSQPLPEGHKLEVGGEAEEGSDSGETDATDNDLTALARPARSNPTATTQPLSPVTKRN